MVDVFFQSTGGDPAEFTITDVPDREFPVNGSAETMVASAKTIQLGNGGGVFFAFVDDHQGLQLFALRSPADSDRMATDLVPFVDSLTVNAG